jgi:hypothetical protein
MKKIALLPVLALALMMGTAQAQKQKEKAKAETKAEAKKAESKAEAKAESKSDASVRVNVNDEGDGTHVRVEKTKDGKTEILERSFNDQASADRFLDSVNRDTGNKMRITVRGGRNRNFYYGDDGTVRVYTPGVPAPPKAPRAPRFRDDPEFRAEMREFERDMEKFGRDMERWGREYGARMKDWGERFGREFRYNWEPQADATRRIMEKQADASRRALENLNLNRLEGFTFFDGNGTTSSRTVKALHAYPNQPSNGRLNITFQTPEKGDVTIVVTDVEGKEVAREKVKDFFGKYLGQVELKRGGEKGTYFVTVSQGNDGAVRRVVIE